MTLATKCPACATVFRVVQDQLRVSEGWVRCGRCAEVFNAVSMMVELPRVPPSDDPDTEIQFEAAPHFDFDESAPMSHDVDDEHVVEAEVNEPELAAPRRPEADFDIAPGVDAAIGIDDSERRGLVAMTAAAQAIDAAPDTPTPSFMQAAERAQRWRQPWLRRAFTGTALLAGLVLTLQVTTEYRDLIAARWPDARAPLQALCRALGCRVEPPRVIDSVVVDSSGLTRVEGTNTYRFTLALRNRSAMELAMPAVDLVLTDSQGRVIARRVMSASELGSSRNTVPGGAEFALQATLAVADRLVAGYTIDVFYP